MDVTPLGNKTSTSPVIQKEIETLRAYGAGIAALGAIDTEEKSKLYRQIKLKYYPDKELENIFKFLKLDF